MYRKLNSLLLLGALLLSPVAISAEKRGCAWSIFALAAELLGFVPKTEAPPSNGDTPEDRLAEFHTGGALAMKPAESPKTAKKQLLEPGQKKEIQVSLNRHTAVDTATLDTMRGYLKAGGEEAEVLQDGLYYDWIKKLIGSRSNIGLLYGNPTAKLEGGSTEATRESLEIVSRVKNEKILVFYDADSRLAPYLSQELGRMGVGISGGSSQVPANADHIVAVIKNPFLRMSAWQKVNQLVMSDNSVTGLGLLFSERGVDVIVSPDKEWKLDLRRWGHTTPVPLGLRFYKEPFILTNAKQYRPMYTSNHTEPELPAMETILSHTDYSTLIEIKEHINILKAGRAAMRSDARTGRRIPGGAALLGSSQNHPAYTQLVYQSGRQLGSRGVTCTTGGSGGYMEVFNTGGFDAGADSLGVPMYGGAALALEKKVASDVQTLTVGSNGYKTRIPLILYERELLVYAPGGDGTIRELGTSFVAAGARADLGPAIVFLADDYYGPMLRDLRASFKSHSFLDRLSIINNENEWPAFLDALERNLGNRIGNLRTQPPTPRNSRTEFPTYSPRSDTKSKWDWLF